MPELLRPLAAEFSGSFAIVFVGILAITQGGLGQGGSSGGGDLVAVALAFGLVVAVMVACLGPVSGGNFNPAATLACLSLGLTRPGRALAYVSAQLAGATAAAALLAALFGTAVVERGCTSLAPGISPLTGLVLEVLATALLFLTAFSAVDNPGVPPALVPLLIGGAVVLDIFAIGPLTGASLNPARSFGPALLSGHWDVQWLYWLGPCTGALGGARLANWLRGGTDRTERRL